MEAKYRASRYFRNLFTIRNFSEREVGHQWHHSEWSKWGYRGIIKLESPRIWKYTRRVIEIWKKNFNTWYLERVIKFGQKNGCYTATQERWQDGGDNYRSISLLNTTYYKTFSKILMKWLTPYVDHNIGNYLCGFRRGKSMVDQLSILGPIVEKMCEYRQNIWQLFIFGLRERSA